ncbi:MAG: ribulose-phosphate 3-epimerase [Lachnospiraceae bacterium]|nr:ribulose-phosphate 3-epimerase [Lachnospiraceae bacterium]
MNRILAPSVLSADFSRLGEEVRATEENGAQYLHLDVMDGIFVPSISFGLPVIRTLRPCSRQIFDVHLMITEPDRYVADFAEAGADIITVHQEACLHLDRTLQHIRELGKKAGVALNPATPAESIRWVLPQVDMVLVMSVNPGFGGQALIPYTLEKVRKLRQMLLQEGLETDIEVDGGVKLSNAREVLAAGANILVAGSAVFGKKTGANTRAFMEILDQKV